MGGSWHTDIEYEPLPIYVSMFFVHHMPVRRDAPGGTWVEPLDLSGEPDPSPYFEGSDPELIRLRKTLPVNGETAFADAAAAFAALPPERQELLERTRVRRRLNEGDAGWLAPLVRTNPRSGIKALHSPIWASRPGVRPAIEVDGMSSEESRVFLDELEAHVLQLRFRYDHLHVPGDVTLWDNYMTLHNTPLAKRNIDSIDDARLLYRLSCKGEPALTLPRNDPPEWLAAHINAGYTTPPAIIDGNLSQASGPGRRSADLADFRAVSRGPETGPAVRAADAGAHVRCGGPAAAVRVPPGEVARSGHVARDLRGGSFRALPGEAAAPGPMSIACWGCFPPGCTCSGWSSRAWWRCSAPTTWGGTSSPAP